MHSIGRALLRVVSRRHCRSVAAWKPLLQENQPDIVSQRYPIAYLENYEVRESDIVAADLLKDMLKKNQKTRPTMEQAKIAFLGLNC